MTDAAWADGSPGELRKINEPKVGRECRLYMAKDQRSVTDAQNWIQPYKIVESA